MRSDYSLYIIAVICFIIAGIFLTGAIPEYTLSDPMGPAVVVIFLVLGILFVIGGYALRPKMAAPTPAPPPTVTEPSPVPSPPLVEEKVEEAPAAPPPAEEQAPSIPPPMPPPTEEAPSPPAPTSEEPAKVEKPVRKRRKKKTEQTSP